METTYVVEKLAAFKHLDQRIEVPVGRGPSFSSTRREQSKEGQGTTSVHASLRVRVQRKQLFGTSINFSKVDIGG